MQGLNEFIKEKRKKAGYKSHEVGPLLGKGVRTYQYYESTGKKQVIPDIDTLKDLAKLFHFSIAEAFQFDEALQIVESATPLQPGSEAGLSAQINEIKAAVSELLKVKDVTEQNRISLTQIEDNLNVLMDWNEALREAVASYLTDTPGQRVKFLETADKFFVRKRLAGGQKDKRHRVGI